MLGGSYPTHSLGGMLITRLALPLLPLAGSSAGMSKLCGAAVPAWCPAMLPKLMSKCVFTGSSCGQLGSGV